MVFITGKPDAAIHGGYDEVGARKIIFLNLDLG
jgi:hypothetical protein